MKTNFVSPFSRRNFLRSMVGSSVLFPGLLSQLLAEDAARSGPVDPLLPRAPHFPPKAKRVIFLYMSGGVSHVDSWDHKPKLFADAGKTVSVGEFQGRKGDFKMFAKRPQWDFARHGQCGTEVSELHPHIGGIADDLCVIRSMHTDAINHDPAITFFQTGSQLPGRPSMGAWTDYGLGRMNDNLPSFVVLVSTNKERSGQGLLARLWGSGFLPSAHQGVQFRGAGEPVLYLRDPEGLTREQRKTLLEGANELNRLNLAATGDPEISARISQAEMAYRMQASVPELMDLTGESKTVMESYGPEVNTPGSFARNALLARRLAEKGVRFIQLYHRDWDHHGSLQDQLPKMARDVDQPAAALVKDLKQRGMLDDTLVIWGGEFGRTPYAQGGANREKYGRDHHGKAFSIWMAGGGIKPGMSFGSTDDFGFNTQENPVHIHDLQATILHCLGIHHERLTYRFQGRQFRLTDVHGKVVRDIIA